MLPEPIRRFRRQSDEVAEQGFWFVAGLYGGIYFFAMLVIFVGRLGFSGESVVGAAIFGAVFGTAVGWFKVLRRRPGSGNKGR